ncbi:hypothetical protein TNCV_1078551 [Trichonephila clavipes]|nr:hypothetical protein TNCV_1078551 [Trichonephila clavipes]
MKAVSVVEHFSDHGSIHQKMKKNTTSVRSYPNSAVDGKTPYEEGLVFFHLKLLQGNSRDARGHQLEGRSRKISISAERIGIVDRKTNQEIKRHLDAFTRGRIIGKLEEGHSVTSVAAEFGIAHSIVSRLWRQFQTTGTAIRGFSSGRP